MENNPLTSDVRYIAKTDRLGLFGIPACPVCVQEHELVVYHWGMGSMNPLLKTQQI